MATRKLTDERSITLPTVEADELSSTDMSLDGEFDLHSVLVDGGDHAGVVGDGRIDTAIVQNVDLSNAKLGPLVLANVVLRAIDLSNTSLQQVVARRVTLHTCRAIGLRLSIDHASDLSIEDTKLDYATMHLEKVKGVAAFIGCSFREAVISGDLSNVLFQDCDFVETEFRATNAAKTDLRSSRFAGARGMLSLRGATISTEQAVAVSGLIASEAGLIVAD